MMAMYRCESQLRRQISNMQLNTDLPYAPLHSIGAWLSTSNNGGKANRESREGQP
ncbi:hypothetical protein BH10PLA2_BH10PLA2_11760 [soil metagenome]